MVIFWPFFWPFLLSVFCLFLSDYSWLSLLIDCSHFEKNALCPADLIIISKILYNSFVYIGVQKIASQYNWPVVLGQGFNYQAQLSVKCYSFSRNQLTRNIVIYEFSNGIIAYILREYSEYNRRSKLNLLINKSINR